MRILLALFLIVPLLAFADTNVRLQVETPGAVLYDDVLSVAPCAVTDDAATTTTSAKCALEQAGLEPEWTNFGSDDWFLSAAGKAAQDPANNLFWGWWTDLAYGETALNKHELHENEELLVALGLFPLRLDVSPDPTVGATTTVTVEEFGFDGSFSPVWTPAEGAIVHAGSETYATYASGIAEILIASGDTLDIHAEKSGFVGSETVSITPTAPEPMPEPAPVPSPVDIVFEIHTATTTLFSGPLTVEACPERPDSATSTVHGFCAFAAANLPVNVTWGTFGAFVTGIGGVENSLTDFWLWFLNGDVAPVGIDSYLLEEGDSVLWAIGREPLKITVSNTSPQVGGTTTVTVTGFDLFDFAFEPVASSTLVGIGATTNASGTAEILATSTAPFTIFATADGFLRSSAVTITATSDAPAPGAGGGGDTVRIELNIPLALSYLAGEQGTDGSFGLQLFTDWAAIAFAAAEKAGHAGGNAVALLRSYLTSATPSLSSVTDYERHAMALMALGINPYSGSPLDSITPIVDAFDGTQMGSPDFENDDIFALFPLLKAGYTSDDEIIQDTVAFIVSRQAANGSWVGSVDLTAAAVQALSQVKGLPGVQSALARAESYLRASQKSDGGFGNSFSTSWTLQAIAALGQSQTNWMQSNKTPEEYLASLQQTDGGIEEKTLDAQTRLWATEFAIPAALEQSWPSLLSSFSKPGAQTNTSQASSGGGGGGGGIVVPVATSTATSTDSALATTTPNVEVLAIENPEPEVSEPSASTLASSRQAATETVSVDETAGFPAETPTGTVDVLPNESQLAAAGAVDGSFETYVFLALLLLLSALGAAFAYPALSRLFR